MAVNRCPNCFEATNATPCPHCGWQPGQDNPPPALALGRVLDGRYRVGRVLGHGGFGITYLAWDENLHLRLAIKEYFPRDSAGRSTDGVSLAVYSGQASDQFAYGLDRFLEEARTLAHFDQHPGIVTVKNFFRAHGTGYCVMDYVEGITLRQYLDQQPGGRISFEAALKLLMPVMDALRAVHKEGLLHRDIAPDNIYLTQDGRIKLLDFGAARFAASEHSKSLSVILKPGYAPEEQYRTRGKQGPWTDVYGLGATFYRAITGQVPPEALDRLDDDELMPPSKLGIAMQPLQEAALLKSLAVKARERYQSMQELQQVWRSEGHALPPRQDAQGGLAKRPDLVPRPARPAKVSKNRRNFAIAGVLTFIVGVVFGLWEIAITGGLTLLIVVVMGLWKTGNNVESFTEGKRAFEQGEYGRAQTILRPLAEAGDAMAGFYIGLMYDNGQGVAQDVAAAVRWYRKAAEQGHADAQFNLGIMYDLGQGIAQDEAEAVRWYRKAADQGHAAAQYNLGIMYANGRGVAQDEAEAVRWFRQAANQGDADAQFSLGVMYANGQGVAQDAAVAVRWFRQAAEQGHAAAQFSLGVMYAKGRGVAKDEAEAVRWYRKAAEQGHADAQYNLGIMYANGRGIAKDEAEAVRLVRKAANQGDADAQFLLGWSYEEGEAGIVKNQIEAVSWYRKAAHQDHAEAKAALKRLGK